MPNYRYVALNSQGREVRGKLVAETESDARELLAQRQYRVQTISETRPLGHHIEIWLASLRPVSLLELAFTTRQFSLMVTAGIPITRCLQFVANQPLSGVLKEAWSEAERMVQSGHSLSQAMRRHPQVFSEYYVGMVYAGEASGNFSDCLDSVSNCLEKEALTRAKVRAAITYPSVVLTLGLLMTLAISQWILPTLTEGLFQQGMELPWPTIVVIEVTKFFNKPLMLPGTLLACVLLGFLALQYLNTPAGRERLQSAMLATPVLNRVLGKVLATRFCRTFASLIRVGVPLTKCIQVSSAVMANVVMSNHLGRIEANVMEGGKLHEGLRQVDFFPPLVASFMELGEDTGRISESLERVADVLDDELDVDLETFTSMLEPMAMGLLGLFVLFIILAIFLPLNSMLGSLG